MDELINETASQEAAIKYDDLPDDKKAFLKYDFWLKRYCQLVANYSGSKKQLQRVMFNAAVVHMTKEEIKHSYSEEKELFETLVELDSAKFFVLLNGFISDLPPELKEPLLKYLEAKTTGAGESEQPETKENENVRTEQ